MIDSINNPIKSLSNELIDIENIECVELRKVKNVIYINPFKNDKKSSEIYRAVVTLKTDLIQYSVFESEVRSEAVRYVCDLKDKLDSVSI